MAPPSGSLLPVPSKVQDSPVHDCVNAATGSCSGGATAVTVTTSVSLAPSSSVTVRVAVQSPPEAKLCVGLAPEAVRRR